MEHAGAMYVVEFEALDEGSVDERRMRGGETAIGPPHAANRRDIDPGQRSRQDATPVQPRAKDGATKCVEHEQLDARDDLGRNALVGEVRDKGRHSARVWIATCVGADGHAVNTSSRPEL